MLIFIRPVRAESEGAFLSKKISIFLSYLKFLRGLGLDVHENERFGCGLPLIFASRIHAPVRIDHETHTFSSSLSNDFTGL